VQVGVGDVLRAAEAFGDVLAGQLDVDTARVGAQRPVHLEEALDLIYDAVDPDANIIIGAVVDEALEGEIHVTVIATGFQSGGTYRPERAAPSFADSLTTTEVERGAKIPPFLLNRQTRID
jgi:hypothetical protein